ILAAAVLLSRLPFAPLKTRHWILLGLGLTQVPVAAAVFVSGWFFLVGSRPTWTRFPNMARDFLQLLLLAYTLGFLIALTGAVYSGLVSSPDMEVEGAGSHASQ